MRLYYNGVTLGAVNAAELVWGRQLRRNKAGIGVGFDWRADVPSVRFAVAGQADADVAIAAIEAALATANANLILANDDGSDSAKNVYDAPSFSGVRCVSGPTWSARPGAQHVTFLEYACSFEWHSRLAGLSSTMYLDFSETVSIDGGEPFAVVLEPINVASPELQITVPQQGWRSVQEGYAVGVSQYPTPPDPIAGLGTRIVNRVSKTTPQRIGRGKEGYAIRWTYQFVKATAATGNPTEWSS